MAVKKKAARKKTRSAAKKKTTRSAAKKKTAVRSKGKGKGTRAARHKTHRFKYFCQASTCGVVPSSKHMSPGDKVILTATGTNATLTFAASPFLSGHTVISLMSGVPQNETIGGPLVSPPPVPPRHFSYTIACDSCQGTVVSPPEMIVP